MNIENFILDKELPVGQPESVHHQLAINGSENTGSRLLLVVFLLVMVRFNYHRYKHSCYVS